MIWFAEHFCPTEWLLSQQLLQSGNPFKMTRKLWFLIFLLMAPNPCTLSPVYPETNLQEPYKVQCNWTWKNMLQLTTSIFYSPNKWQLVSQTSPDLGWERLTWQRCRKSQWKSNSFVPWIFRILFLSKFFKGWSFEQDSYEMRWCTSTIYFRSTGLFCTKNCCKLMAVSFLQSFNKGDWWRVLKYW